MNSAKQVQINATTIVNKDTFFEYNNEGNMTHSKEKEDKIIMIPKECSLNRNKASVR